MTKRSSKSTMGILDLLFPLHKKAETFLSVNELLDGESSPLSREERFALYAKCVEHFHCLGRNYTAFWNRIGKMTIDITRFDSSLYNVVLTQYGQRIDAMPLEVAEMNYSLTEVMRDPHRARAMSLFMTEMLAVLDGYAPARLAS